jgi:hypothetical protein
MKSAERLLRNLRAEAGIVGIEAASLMNAF